jgi:hypothetical protein
VLVKYFRPSIKRKNVEQLEEEFKNMTVNDINWMSYGSNGLQVPRNFEDRLLLKYAVAPCIDFYSIHMIRPDLCYRQLGLAEDGVRHIDVPNRSLLKPCVNKGMDFKSYVRGINKKKEYNYAELNEMWANRLSYLVIDLPVETESGVLKYLLFSTLMMSIILCDTMFRDYH